MSRASILVAGALLFSLGFSAPEEQPVSAELIAEHASVLPGGRTRIGVHFEIEEGWHIYADPPGDAGLPTAIAWSGPAGVAFGPLRGPKPQTFIDPGDIRTFGYAGAAVLYSELTTRARLPIGRVLPIRAKVRWLACKEICIPGAAEFDLALPVSETAPVASTHAELFEHAN